MKMTVIGCGHLGTTHSACMASLGHEVIGVDIDEAKISLLNSGRAWFHEPDLDPMLAENIAAGRLRFTLDIAEAAGFAEVHFIGVATPGRDDGSYDLSQLHAVLSALIPKLRGGDVIIGKSTVPPGTAAELQAMADDMLRPGQERVEIVWNPEFLREGCAVRDTLWPDRIVAGVTSATGERVVREVYQAQADAGIPLLVTDLATAELAKGAANAFLATKISFINAMADVCAAAGGDIAVLAESLGLDPRIGGAFLKAGIGYGGACLPKDVRGLGAFAGQAGAANAARLLGVVDQVNAGRGAQVVDLVTEAASGVDGKRVAVWGAAFKPGTDDVRDSAGLRVAESLCELGAEVSVYDPIASGNAFVACPELEYAGAAVTAAAGADVIVVVTAWPEFASVDPAELADVVAGKVIVDACQGVDIADWQAAGWRVASLTGVPAAASQPAWTA